MDSLHRPCVDGHKAADSSLSAEFNIENPVLRKRRKPRSAKAGEAEIRGSKLA
jgi:hypothetical protein